MSGHIDGRVESRSGPGVGWLRGAAEGLAARLVRQDRAWEAAEAVGDDGEYVDGRAMAVARLSAAADDAAELSQAFGADAALAVQSVRSVPFGLDSWGVSWEALVGAQAAKAARCARLAFRLAEQAEALRSLADAVQEAGLLPEGVCGLCGGPVALDNPARLCGPCWQRGR